MTDLLTLIESNAANQPAKTALVFEDDRLTYGAFADAVARTAAGLRDAGVRPGDAIAVAAYRGNAVAVVTYALQWIGAVPVLASAALLADLDGALADTDARGIVYGPEARPRVETCRAALRIAVEPDGLGLPLEEIQTSAPIAARDRRPDDISGVIFSAGTTGRPKPIVRTFATDLWDGLQKAILYRLGFQDVWLYISPRNLTALIGPTRPMLLTGSRYVVIDGFDARRVAAVCAAERVSQLTLLTGQWAELLDLPDLDGYDLSALRQVAAAASAVPEAIKQRLRDRFGDLPLLQVYGTSEAGMISAVQAGDRDTPGGVGRPLPTVRVRITGPAGDLPDGAIGEITVAGPSAAPGYFRRGGDTFRDGWVHTGDLGRLDDGYLTLIDRASSVFSVGGVTIYPSLVQEAIFALPGVREAAAVGRPAGEDARPTGLTVFVVPLTGATIDVERIRRAAADRAGIPIDAVHVEERPSLPRTPAGKVNIRALLVGG